MNNLKSTATEKLIPTAMRYWLSQSKTQSAISLNSGQEISYPCLEEEFVKKINITKQEFC